ncbi:hypothetical protein N0V93_000351 [Gnomoniopsis smithogilvyi]|uniref:Diterpenoid pyrone biosynthesis cluster protein C n=1 Tax=Gnomoniopsis smithogilvyi TaxID=1191159 RepID=A0A9W8Z1M5_9PEZI|nr:hypothetical protein N0V93_000351 [Gnomoniopsis smithogilvyi]
MNRTLALNLLQFYTPREAIGLSTLLLRQHHRVMSEFTPKKSDQKARPPADPGLDEPCDPLAQQYGGKHLGGWVSCLPDSLIPFVQLARLSPPAALFLIYFPHFFGAILAAISRHTSLIETSRACFLLLVGSFFFSNAAHAWNDIVDAPVDKAVARTKTRPIPRGAVSTPAALIFCFSQAAACGALLLFLFPTGSIAYAVPNILATSYYPFAKRHTHFAQLILGLCLAWGVIIGSVAMNFEPFAGTHFFKLAPDDDGSFLRSLSHTTMMRLDDSVSVHVPTITLMLACVLWTSIYDTIYAFQDIDDDKKLGLKSMALLFRGQAKRMLWFFLFCMISCLGLTGWAGRFGSLYYIISMGGCSLSLGAMIAHVELKDSANCWWWFRYGFWLAGSSIAAALLSESASRLFQYNEGCSDWIHRQLL